MSKTINTDIIVANGVYRLILTFVGASLKGIYNMDDPEDIPLFSIFVYGKDTRMNTPGTSKDNWAYRITSEQLRAVDTEKFKKLNKLYSRI